MVLGLLRSDSRLLQSGGGAARADFSDRGLPRADHHVGQCEEGAELMEPTGIV